MSRATLRGKGQVTLPSDVRKALGVGEGDELEFEIVEPGVVAVRGMKMIPADQAWFWTESWQAGEREASEDLANGRVTTFRDGDEFLAALERESG